MDAICVRRSLGAASRFRGGAFTCASINEQLLSYAIIRGARDPLVPFTTPFECARRRCANKNIYRITSKAVFGRYASCVISVLFVGQRNVAAAIFPCPWNGVVAREKTDTILLVIKMNALESRHILCILTYIGIRPIWKYVLQLIHTFRPYVLGHVPWRFSALTQEPLTNRQNGWAHCPRIVKSNTVNAFTCDSGVDRRRQRGKRRKSRRKTIGF